MSPTPRIADKVHYVAFGTPGGEYPTACRAATVTAVGAWIPVGRPRDEQVDDDGRRMRTVDQGWDPTAVGLCVANPSGLFFNQQIPYSSLILGDRKLRGGTWHGVTECGPGPGLGQQ